MDRTLNKLPILLPGALADLFAQVSQTGRITLADRYGLMAAILDDSLAEEERASIDRLLYATRLGRMQLVEDISSTARSSNKF